jgi:hypothetical protein
MWPSCHNDSAQRVSTSAAVHLILALKTSRAHLRPNARQKMVYIVQDMQALIAHTPAVFRMQAVPVCVWRAHVS